MIAEIEYWQRLNAMNSDAVVKAMSHVHEAEARIKDLEAALRPFAEIADEHTPYRVNPGLPIMEWSDDAIVRVHLRELRAARAAMEGKD